MPKTLKTKYSKEWLTKAETNQILNDPGISRRDELMISMLYWCALRVSEMAAIKIKDINIKTGNLTLWQSKKSDDPELVHIPEQLIKSISQWSRENKLKPQDYLIRSQKGGSLSRIQIYRSIKDNARRIGIKKKITTHSFRRSRATHLLDGGLPLEKVSRFLRHNRLESTMVYLKISINDLKKDITRIDDDYKQ